jgi:hypothetical protein
MARRQLPLSRRKHGLVLPAVGTTEPLLNRRTLKDADLAFLSEGWRTVRRSAWSALRLSGAELVSKISADRATAESFARLDEEIQQYLKYLRAHMQLLQTASARCSLALCARKDGFELRYEVGRVAGVRSWEPPTILSTGPPDRVVSQ